MYRGSIGNFIGIGAVAMVEKYGHVGNCGVWCRLRKKDSDEKRRPFEVDGKEIFSNRSKQAKVKAGEKMDKKGGKRESVP